MKTIGVVTVSRSDYGIYVPVLRAIAGEATLAVQLFVGGTHLLDEFGRTIEVIQADGFDVEERVDYLLSSDTQASAAKSMGIAILGFADAFRRSRPDLLVVLGDRYDMFAAAVAALPQGIPLAHLHGGELTEGALDDSWRHALTKMSHLHFVSTDDHRTRVLQLGEEPWRVHTVGAPSLDNLHAVPVTSRGELAARLNLALDVDPLLVTFHPETLEPGTALAHVQELLGSLATFPGPIVFTHPNADPEGHAIRGAVDEYAAKRPATISVTNLGTSAYFSLMRIAAAMVGNSSSGIIEAASFRLPVVNVGTRQQGRMHGANVVDVPCERLAIASAIQRVATPTFRHQCAAMTNPYGDGHASARIVDVLRSVELDRLPRKRFVDLPQP